MSSSSAKDRGFYRRNDAIKGKASHEDDRDHDGDDGDHLDPWDDDREFARAVRKLYCWLCDVESPYEVN